MFEGAAIEGWCLANRIVVEMIVETHIFLVYPTALIGTREIKGYYIS